MTDVLFNMKKIPNQPPEYYYGNKEYKLSLGYQKESPKKIKHLLDKKASQMLFRLFEGEGNAKYLIGVEDDGSAIGIDLLDLILSIANMIKITKKINVIIKKITIYKGSKGFIASVKINNKFSNIHTF